MRCTAGYKRVIAIARQIRTRIRTVPSLSRCRLIMRLDKPDVAELNRHAMFLQHERAGRRLSHSSRSAVWKIELLVIVDFDAVEKHRRAGVFGFLAAGIKSRGVKIDVEGLPSQAADNRGERAGGSLSVQLSNPPFGSPSNRP